MPVIRCIGTLLLTFKCSYTENNCIAEMTYRNKRGQEAHDSTRPGTPPTSMRHFVQSSSENFTSRGTFGLKIHGSWTCKTFLFFFGFLSSNKKAEIVHTVAATSNFAYGIFHNWKKMLNESDNDHHCRTFPATPKINNEYIFFIRENQNGGGPRLSIKGSWLKKCCNMLVRQ